MATLEDVIVELIARVTKLEADLDDLRAQAGETTSVDSVGTLPASPYDGQIVLLSDSTGVNNNGSFYRFDASVGDWVQIL